MNTLTQKLVSSLATGLLLVAIVPTSAFAQTPGAQTPQIVNQGPAITPRPDLVRIIKRPAIPFKPFEVRDLKTGKALEPNSQITLPNGRRMTAQQYFDQLNQTEQKLNEIGYSLRDPQKKNRIQETNINRQALLQQANAISSRQKSNSGQPVPATIQDAQKGAAEQSKADAQRMQILQTAFEKYPVKVLPTKAHTEKSWSYSLGDPSLLSAYFKGKLVLDGTKDVTNVSAEADAGGSVFNYTQSLLRLTANINAPKTGTMNAKLDASVLGHSVYNLNQNVNTSWNKSDSVSKTLDFSTPTFRFPLGPFSLSVKVGVQGSSQVAYFVNLNALSARAMVIPKVRTAAYAQVGIDVYIAGAGVRGNLTFLEYELRVGGQCTLDVDSTGRPYVFEYFYGQEDITCLKGNLELYVWVWNPFGDNPEWSWDLWSWGGFNRYDTLFNDTKKTYLVAAATPAARVEPLK